jgi:hypothetical protein
VENLTGRKARTARSILQKIREHCGKPKNTLVTIKDFCSYMRIGEDEVRAQLEN